MDFRQLRTFVHVAELGSICAAASRLNTAQSALTRQIQQLEQELDVRLLQRHGRGVTLTPKGEALLGKAKVILNEVQSAREEARAEPASFGGTATVALPPDIASLAASRLITRFVHEFPKVELSIMSGFSGDVLEWTGRGIADVAVFCHRPDSPLFRPEIIASETLVAVGHARILKPAKCGELSIEEIAALPLVLPSARHGLRQIIDMAATRAGTKFSTVADIDCLNIQAELLRAGDAMTIMPESAARHLFAGAGLQVLRLADEKLRRELAIGIPIDRPIDPASFKLRNIAIEEISAALQALNTVRPMPVRLAS